MLVPSMLYALIDHPDSRTRDLSSLETVYYGASAINPVRLAEAHRAVRADLRAVLRPVRGADGDQLPRQGRPRPGPTRAARLAAAGRRAFLRTALLDEDGKPVAPGEPGEICVAGPLLAGGYWNLPEETAETFRDGWMHTGDVAREDEDGFWYIVDRTKDMIVTGGFNVFPREVEDVVAEHPAVAQVGVIGTPAREVRRGRHRRRRAPLRRSRATTTRSPDREIQELVKERKGSVQSPKQVIAADALPLTGLGKPDKKALRATYWTGARSVG